MTHLRKVRIHNQARRWFAIGNMQVVILVMLEWYAVPINYNKLPIRGARMCLPLQVLWRSEYGRWIIDFFPPAFKTVAYWESNLLPFLKHTKCSATISNRRLQVWAFHKGFFSTGSWLYFSGTRVVDFLQVWPRTNLYHTRTDVILSLITNA